MADDISTLRRILRDARTIAVVGLSADWYRPSFFAAKYMQGKGYRIVPVNPKYVTGLQAPAPQPPPPGGDGSPGEAASTRILGEKCYARLEDIPFPVDIVDVFRKESDVVPIARSAVAIGAKCLWQQLGVRNLDADRIARDAGLDSVMDRCVKIEHARLFGGLHWAGVNTKVISAKRPV